MTVEDDIHSYPFGTILTYGCSNQEDRFIDGETQMKLQCVIPAKWNQTLSNCKGNFKLFCY